MLEQKVRIIPLSKRAKDRVREHGEVMILEASGLGNVRVRSVEKTWRGEYWVGWFKLNEEAKIETIKDSARTIEYREAMAAVFAPIYGQENN